MAMVFYKEGTFRNGELSVSVDKACALMIKDGHSGNAELHIADPGQTQSCIKVELLIPEISSERRLFYVILEIPVSMPVHPKHIN